jgi:hypothetical protein
MTEPASRASPRIHLSPLEWRLYIIAALAGVYLLAGRAIWLDELPAARSSHGAPAAGSPSPSPSPVVRAPSSRPLRVRTRSS